MSSGMQNAQNFAAIISSMVLEPSFFDLFSCFPSFGFFYGPGYGLGRGLGPHGPHGGFINPKGGGVGRGGVYYCTGFINPKLRLYACLGLLMVH